MRKRKYGNIKVEYDGIMFDSIDEKNFYIYLQENKKELGIESIRVHPLFVLIPAYTVDCLKCDGSGKVKSPRGTGRDVQCRSCKGSGDSQREDMTYTPDFMTYHENDKIKVYDVKGKKNDSFPIKKKIFETTFGFRVIEVYRKRREWIFK